MITVRNTQRKIRVDTKKLRNEVQKILAVAGYADFEVGILITTDAGIQKYNREFRHRDCPTDVLSFPYQQIKVGAKIIADSYDEAYLGDIIISAPAVVRDALAYGVTYEQRLRVLLVHSICHLLGYEHETAADYRKMQAKEKALLGKLHA